MQEKHLTIVGMQFGDEGKGKITDSLSHHYDYVVRFQGGHNAGHTVYANGKKHVLHVLPTGIVHEKTINVLGNGMVLSLDALRQEIKDFNLNQIRISDRVHLLFPFHQQLDRQSEQIRVDKIGTTQKGIGPAYQGKSNRQGIRAASLLNLNRFAQELTQLSQALQVPFDVQAYLTDLTPFILSLQPYITDTSMLIDEAMQRGKKVLFEGAQGVMLDLDHGTYPYVTSSHPTMASIPVNIGLPPSRLTEGLGIVKAYTTRVGEGPFPTEIHDALATHIRETGKEYGATTGRPRRIGYLDVVMLKHAIRVSGVTAIAITLLDVLTGVDPIKIAVAYQWQGKTIDRVPAHAGDLAEVTPIYETLKGWHTPIQEIKDFQDLPLEAKTYLARIETLLGLPIRYVSNGPNREQLIERNPYFK